MFYTTAIMNAVTVGLAASLPGVLYGNLTRAGLPASAARGVANLPPTATLFATFLGYSPLRTLLPPQVLNALPAASQQRLLSTAFFPTLIAGPFEHGLLVAFSASAALCVLAAVASLLRGKRYIHELEGVATSGQGNQTMDVDEQEYR